MNANNAQRNSVVTFVLLQLLHIYKWTAKLQFENYNNFELESFDKTQLNKLNKINSLRREKEKSPLKIPLCIPTDKADFSMLLQIDN